MTRHHRRLAVGTTAGAHALSILVGVLCAVVTTAVKINLVSDEHYDPAYGTAEAYGACATLSAPPFGRPGCDTPRALLAVATIDMIMQRSVSTLYGGDWQRHGMGSTSLTTTDVFMPMSQYFHSLALTSTEDEFIGLRVATALGNNDVIPDYFFDTAGPSQATIRAQVGVMKKYALLNTTQGIVMSHCGFYSSRASGRLRVLSLHSLLWTYKLLPALADTETDPCDQFSWMEEEINAARTAGEKVILIGHIPPLPNVYKVIKKGIVGPLEKVMYWKPIYQKIYTNIVSGNKDIITLQLFGHTHRFSIVGDEEMGVPLVVMNAITPLFGNQPAYLVADFDSATWRLRNLTQRFANNGFALWNSGLEVATALGITDLSDASSVHAAVARMFTDDAQFERYMTLRTGGAIDAPCTTAFCRVYTICAMMCATYDAINSCVFSQIPLTVIWQRSNVTINGSASDGVDTE